jgi:hypothetical protein
MIASHLAQAEEHVRLGEKHLAAQRAIVTDMESKGADVTQARDLLTTFMSMQANHVADRDRIARELSALDHAAQNVVLAGKRSGTAIDPPIVVSGYAGATFDISTVEQMIDFLRRYDGQQPWTRIRNAAFVAAAVPSWENIDALRALADLAFPKT